MIFLQSYKQEIYDYVDRNAGLLKELNGKSIVVTGAAGLIGSYLIDILLAAKEKYAVDCKIVAIDKNADLLNQRFPESFAPDLKRETLDVNSRELDLNGIDFVIHAASNTSPADYATRPVDTVRTNIVGTDRILSSCVRHGVKRFMFCSSVEAYGQNNGDTDDFYEDYSGYVNSNTLRAGYPSAKRAAEALCNAYASEYSGFEFVIARIGRIYGPTVIAGDTKAPSQFINNAVNGEDIVLKSDGMQQFSYGYVGDCATALLYILIRGKSGEAYNVADKKSKILLREFAAFSAKAGKTEIVFQAPTSIEAQGYSKITKATMSTEKTEALGWDAVYSAEDGIKRTVEYLKTLKQGEN